MASSSFVAREGELQQLHDFLDRALAGQAQLCFVAGDAGAGKSTLVGEFTRRAEERHDALAIAIGECNAQTGLGDPFLPFRQILVQLTGDAEAKRASGKMSDRNAARLSELASVSARAVVEYAPDLINTLIPGSKLVADVVKFGAQKAGWLDKLEKEAAAPPTNLEEKMVFQQVANLLRPLAKEQPLLLILDDLHWADQASVALLFHLQREIRDARLLLVGTFRPNDIAIGRDGTRHPLDSALNEIGRYRGDVILNLNNPTDDERRAFVEALVDREPNRLDADFRRALLDKTGGHPLFVVELLRALQECGDLVRDEKGGPWRVGGELDWDAMPARAESVVAERIDRLEPELRDLLCTASVEGQEFTVQVLARLREMRERDLLKTLSDDLERRHQLVREGDEVKVGRQRLWHYHFTHALFQRYLYDDLSRGERRLLHGDVARILEELYDGRTDEIVLQLAHHHEEAGDDERAVVYLKRAGELAAETAGHAAAIRHFSHALELTPPDARETLFDLLRAREGVLHLQGEREAQWQDIEAMGALAERLKDRPRQAEVALCRARYALATSDYDAMVAAAERAVGLAAGGAAAQEAEGLYLWGGGFYSRAEYAPAKARLEQALAVARAAGQRGVETDILCALGHVHGGLEEYDLRQPRYEESLQLARDIEDRRREAAALKALGRHAAHGGDFAAARQFCEDALRLEREAGNRRGEGMVLHYLGLVAAELGDFARARSLYDERLRLARDIDDRSGEANTLAHLTLVDCYTGADPEAALAQATAAVAIAEALESPTVEALAQLALGHVLATLGGWRAAEVAFDRALALQRALSKDAEAMELLAALARVALADAALPAALPRVEEILAFLQTRALGGEVAASAVYLACYQVLQAAGDPRAGDVLQAGHTFLQARAARLPDEAERRSFLENVPHNRDLLAAWEAKSDE